MQAHADIAEQCINLTTPRDITPVTAAFWPSLHSTWVSSSRRMASFHDGVPPTDVLRCSYSPGTFFYYRWRNAKKEAVWSKMSLDERAEYLSTTKEQGCKRLDFRFAY